MFKFLVLISFLTSCTTPDLWRPEEHRRMMMQCRVSCGKANMASYEAWTAECTCHSRQSSVKRKTVILDEE